MAGKTIVKARQTVMDLAVQQQGAAHAIFDVATLNGVGITDDLLPGAEVKYGDVMVSDVAEYFRKYGEKGIYPASSIQVVIRPGGIGYMGIQIDFIVS